MSEERGDATSRASIPARPSRPQISRGALYLFLTLVVLLIAQAGWWVVYQILESRRAFQMAVERAQRERQIAALEVESRVRAGASLPQVAAYLTRHYPYLEIGPAFEPSNAKSDSAVVIASRVQVEHSHLEKLESEVRRRAIMFLGEGSFFLCLILIGIYLIHSTLQREVALKQQQSNFISAVTHELKSPLASVRLYLQTLQLRKLDAERTERYIRHMLQDVDRLEILVENLLEAGKLETRGFKLHRDEADLGEEVEAFLAGRRQHLAELQVELEVQVASEPTRVLLDRHALVTILSNLLENAVKYSKPPRRIAFRVFRQGKRAVLEIQDNGVGLAREHLTAVFQKFFRVGNELVRQVKGTGLGLFLVDGLVRAHGGRVEAESPGIGQGTTFRIVLPLESEHAYG